MQENDYTLTLDDVSRRLNKSPRTIQRYKGGGRLTSVVAATQGNPLLFSRSEVEALAGELYPSLRPSEGDPQFWDRLERLERLVNVLEENPLIERVLRLGHVVPLEAMSPEIEEALRAALPPALLDLLPQAPDAT